MISNISRLRNRRPQKGRSVRVPQRASVLTDKRRTKESIDRRFPGELGFNDEVRKGRADARPFLIVYPSGYRIIWGMGYESGRQTW